MLNNASIFKFKGLIGPGLSLFSECGATQERSSGFVPPRGEGDQLAERQGLNVILKFRVDRKTVPSAAIKRMADERAEQIERETGRKPGKKEMRDLRDEAKHVLLPHAFERTATAFVWLDLGRGRLVIDSASQSMTDEVITALVKSGEGFEVSEFHTKMSASACMSTWLLEQEAPGDFSIDRACELNATDASKAVVRYRNVSLDIPEIAAHIAQGKLPTLLAMTWEDAVSFELTDGRVLRKLKMRGVESRPNDVDAFDADVALMTGTLGPAISALATAMGGEA